MSSPDRTLVHLLVYALLFLSALLIAGSTLLFDGSTSSIEGIRTLWCIVAPASFFDWAVHSSAFGAWMLVAMALLNILQTVRRERSIGAELSSAARAARLGRPPGHVAVIADLVNVGDCLDVVDAKHPFAIVYGWMHPRICLSVGMIERLNARELEAVLRHERWHRVRRDPIRFLVVHATAAAFRAVPVMRRLEHQYRLGAEIAADRHAVRAMGNERWLASALAKLVACEAPGRASFLGCADARIAALAGELPTDRTSHGRIAGLCLLGEAAFVSVLLTQGAWSHTVC